MTAEEMLTQVMEKKRKKSCSCGSTEVRVHVNHVMTVGGKKEKSVRLEKIECVKCWRTIRRPQVVGEVYIDVIREDRMANYLSVQLGSEMGSRKIRFWCDARNDIVTRSYGWGRSTISDFISEIQKAEAGGKFVFPKDNRSPMPKEFIKALVEHKEKIISELTLIRLGVNNG